MSICRTEPAPARSSACAAAAPIATQGPITRTELSAAGSPSAQRPAATRLSACCGTSARSEEHTSELQSLLRTSYAVFCLTKKHTTGQVKDMLLHLLHVEHKL